MLYVVLHATRVSHSSLFLPPSARTPAHALSLSDLKPHNVLLTEAGRAKLSDMGLSKQLVAEQSSFESHGAGEE
jgi:serine/threonine protein kinase